MALGVAVLLALAPALSRAAEPPAAAAPPAQAIAITDSSQIYGLSTEAMAMVHPLKIEGRVSYFDRRWRHLWIKSNGPAGYILLSLNPPSLEQGQRVRIEGTIVPSKGLDAAAVRVTVLQAGEPAEALSAEGRICEVEAFNSQIVTAQGYVDGLRLIDDDHLRLALVVEDQPVIGWVKPDNPRSLPDWQGKFVRMTGLYQGRFDPTRTQMTIELWTGRQDAVAVVGSIEDSRLFEIPRTPINELYLAPPNRDVRIRGQVQADQPGAQLIVRDDTGQVVVRSVQQQRVLLGAVVEAVGQVQVNDAQWTLRSALFRVAPPAPEAPRLQGAAPAALTRIDEIRQLGAVDAAKGLPVEITGTVTWSLYYGADYFFLEDITGGIRVRFQHGQMEAPLRYKYLRIEGVTYNGGFTPAVDLKRYWDLGSMSPPRVREITFEQAISGQEDGQLVDMHGFYQRTESEGDVRRIHVTTPGGEFVALLVSPLSFAATPGSLVRIRGVCEGVADENGRLTGIVLRTPSLPEVIIEHDAPADFYNLPLRSLKDLGQLSTARELMRVRVSGIVLHAVPGRMIYLQEDGAAAVVLSSETQPLSPGDRIEAVGIPGSEGARAVLRAATYRKLGAGPPQAAVSVQDPSRLSVALDSRLVRIRGTLVDALVVPDRTRLTLQAGSTFFEALLNQTSGTAAPGSLTVGEGLEVTGIYRVIYDDSRQARRFQLELRSAGDIAVFQKARLWTLQRALTAAAVLGGLTMLGLGWITALERRVRRQTEQIRRQLEHQAKLEADLQHAARLESLGVLAGGIAHDFNNLLTVIMGNASFAMLSEKAMEGAGDCLREIQKGATQARDLTQQLLTFAKGGNPLRATVSLPGIVQDTTEFVLRGSTVRSEFDFPADLWNASVDRDQTAQVIQNLVLNAAQAMPDGGIVRISLLNETIGAGTKAALSPGPYIRLTIADSGRGITREVLPRIFDPYFSTKKAGSGLGLATVYSIIKKHQGHIEVESELGQGTTFTVWLPSAGPASAAPQPAESGRTDPLLPGRAARVLLMDDDENIRRVGAMVLKHMGLEATLVGDGEEAVRVFGEAQSAGQPFDLLILDLTVPGGMGGKATIERIRKMDSRVPAIVSSGYSNDPVLADFTSFGFQAMVSKPYEVAQLAAAIRELLPRQT